MLKCTGSEKPKESIPSDGESVRGANLKVFLKDHDKVCDYLVAILTDSYNNNSLFGKADFVADRKTIIRRFRHEGLSFATKTLPALFDSVLTYLETGVSVYLGYTLAQDAKYPAFLRQLIAPIYDDPNSEHTVICMSQLYQVCVAFKKLEGPYKQGVLDKQLVDFVETDIELRYLEFDAEPNRAILRHARRTIGRVLKGLDPFDPAQAEWFLPQPGPGATNTPTKAHVRFRPHVKYTTLDTWFPYDEWFTIPRKYTLCSNYGVLTTTQKWAHFLQYMQDRIGGNLYHKGLLGQYEPTSRLKFVPKTYSKARGICIEQLETQYLQQGIKNALYHRIMSHPETKGKVNFTDQNVNGELALYGSSTGSLATIDMSSASDRISRKLVSYLFADNPNILDGLLALSTNTIELPDGIGFITDFPSAKYAPMGSALCFPVMALVHYALVKAIIVFSSRPHDEASCVYVYGDDIIIPTGCAQAIYDWLPRFGMKLNVEKSFTQSRFRESCGLHAYNGHVITPLRFKSVIKKSKPRFNELISALRLESKFFYKNYLETARLIRSQVLGVPGFRYMKNVPVVSPQSSILGWIREDKDAPEFRHIKCTKSRWAKGTDHRGTPYDYQCRLFRVLCLVPKQEKLPPLSEVEGYLRKLVTRVKEKPRHVDGSCDDFRIRHKWLPESAF